MITLHCTRSFTAEENKNTMLLSEHCWFLLTSSMEEIAPLTGSRSPSPPRLHRPAHSSLPGRTQCTPCCRARSGPWLISHCSRGILAAGPKAVLAPVLWAKGAGCLGWRMDKWNHQNSAGIVCKRLWDTASSLLALIAMAIIAMVSALPHSPCSVSFCW